MTTPPRPPFTLAIALAAAFLAGCAEFDTAVNDINKGFTSLGDSIGKTFASPEQPPPKDGVSNGSAATPPSSAGSTSESMAPENPDRFRDPLVVSQLREKAWDMLTALASDTDPQLRANALEAMAQTPARLEPLLIPALKDPNPGVRSTAAMMIGRLRLAASAPAARPLLSDSSPFARASAIYALSRCGLDVNSTPLAGMLLSDPSPRVRAHAAFLLGEMGEASAAGLLREAARSAPPRLTAEYKLLLVQVSEALAKLGDEAQVEPIRAALYPSSPEDLEVTALAVQIIGQLKDRASTDELIYLTAYKDKSGHMMPAEIRLAAASSLARLGLDKGGFVADEFVASEKPVLRSQAAFVYGEIGRAETLPRLDKLMTDASGIVRVAAAGAVLKVNQQPVATK